MQFVSSLTNLYLSMSHEFTFPLIWEVQNAIHLSLISKSFP